MNKKKVLAIIASVALVASLFAGCGQSNSDSNQSADNETQQEEQQEQSEAKKGADIKIGLSTDEGGLNDKSFNQAADTGIKKAVEEFGVQYFPIESTKKEDYVPNLQSLSLDQNCDLTFGVGFQMQEALTSVAKANPDKKYAIVDAVVDLPNVESLNFKEQEGSFLVGVVAAKMTKTGKIGYIGGKDFPLINRFTAGYIAGARAVNPDIEVVVKYADSFEDTNKGYEIGKSEYNEGCDIIFHAAGGVGIGLFRAADELKKAGKEVWAIGVDQDQYVTVPEYKDVILTSMIKRVDTATYEATKQLVEGNFQGGTQKVFSLAEEGVGLAPTSDKHVPQDVLDLVAKYEDAIKNGEIVVPDNKDDAMKFTTDVKFE